MQLTRAGGLWFLWIYILMIFQGCSTTELLTKRLSHLNIFSLNNFSLDHTHALGSRDSVSKDGTFYIFYPFFFSSLRSLERGIITKDKGTDKALDITLTCLWKNPLFQQLAFRLGVHIHEFHMTWPPVNFVDKILCNLLSFWVFLSIPCPWFSLLWSIHENDVLIAPFVFENSL